MIRRLYTALLFAWFLIVAAACSSTAQTLNLSQFPGNSIGAKITAAQNTGCSTDTNVTCMIRIDPEMSVFAQGTIPTLNSNVWVIDFRSSSLNIRVIPAGGNAFQNGTISFPLAPSPSGVCTTPEYSWSGVTATVGFTETGGGLILCSNGVQQWAHLSSLQRANSNWVLAWTSSATNPGATAADTGFSRLSAGVVALGNGTASDVSGVLSLATTRVQHIRDTGGANTLSSQMKVGTGGGNYTNTNTAYVRVDSTNLAQAITVPTGWTLTVHASGVASVATAAATVNIALADGTADNTGILIEEGVTPATSGASSSLGWSLNYVLTGDGASHTINLQAKTSAGADAWIIANSSSTNKPVITLVLLPN